MPGDMAKASLLRPPILPDTAGVENRLQRCYRVLFLAFLAFLAALARPGVRVAGTQRHHNR